MRYLSNKLVEGTRNVLGRNEKSERVMFSVRQGKSPVVIVNEEAQFIIRHSRFLFPMFESLSC